MSRCIWALSDDELVSHMTANEEPNARLWLFQLSDEMDHDSFTRMAVTLWLVWYVRRNAVYESIFQSPQQTIYFVEILLQSWDRFLTVECTMKQELLQQSLQNGGYLHP